MGLGMAHLQPHLWEAKASKVQAPELHELGPSPRLHPHFPSFECPAAMLRPLPSILLFFPITSPATCIVPDTTNGFLQLANLVKAGLTGAWKDVSLGRSMRGSS